MYMSRVVTWSTSDNRGSVFVGQANQHESAAPMLPAAGSTRQARRHGHGRIYRVTAALRIRLPSEPSSSSVRSSVAGANNLGRPTLASEAVAEFGSRLAAEPRCQAKEENTQANGSSYLMEFKELSDRRKAFKARNRKRKEPCKHAGQRWNLESVCFSFYG